jgi:hypothetical protein
MHVLWTHLAVVAVVSGALMLCHAKLASLIEGQQPGCNQTSRSMCLLYTGSADIYGFDGHHHLWMAEGATHLDAADCTSNCQL